MDRPPAPRPTPEPASINVRVDGAELRATRKRKGLTITELAAGCGVSRSYVSKIERGDRGDGVHPRIVKALAESLGVRARKITRA